MFHRVGILGVGLIGGSIGLALKDRGLARQVIGIGRREEPLRVARERGAIDAASVGLGPHLGNLDLLVVATPVDQIVSLVEQAMGHLPASAIVTDAGSTKERLVAALGERYSGGPFFVGSHPIAGSEKQGPEHASALLFAGKTCVVTPTPSVPTEVVERVKNFWTGLGMAVRALSAREHDRVLGRTSHLPHVLATCLSNGLLAGDDAFVGSGFRDATRTAAGDPSLWSAIFAQNQESVIQVIDDFQTRLGDFRQALSEGDFNRVCEILEHGKKSRDAVAN